MSIDADRSNMSEDCACGHFLDEHEGIGGAGGCDVEDCPCIHFEAGDEPE